MVDTLEDYRRVCHEEYTSAMGFAGLLVSSGYGVYYNFQEQNSYSSILLCLLTAIACGPLAVNSFRQGRLMAKKVSELEQELMKDQ